MSLDMLVPTYVVQIVSILLVLQLLINLDSPWASWFISPWSRSPYSSRCHLVQKSNNNNVCQTMWMKRVLKRKIMKEMSMSRDNSWYAFLLFKRSEQWRGCQAYSLWTCGTQDQVADVMTKFLKLNASQKLQRMFGVCEAPVVNSICDARLRERMIRLFYVQLANFKT